MDVVFNSIYARACMGAGLAVLSGFRAFLPIAFLALYSRLEFASAPVLQDTWFKFLEHTWVIAVLFALAVIELAMTSCPPSRMIRPDHATPHDHLRRQVFADVLTPRTGRRGGVRHPGLAIAGLADHAMRSVRTGPTADNGPRVLQVSSTISAVLIARWCSYWCRSRAFWRASFLFIYRCAAPEAQIKGLCASCADESETEALDAHDPRLRQPRLVSRSRTRSRVRGGPRARRGFRTTTRHEAIRLHIGDG
jgi:hypothetical protein